MDKERERALTPLTGERALTPFPLFPVCSGEPVSRGTRVPLAQVVEQFRAAVPFSDIAEDYPQLTEKALRYAQLCARMGQAPGRPTKALTLRRTAIEAAD